MSEGIVYIWRQDTIVFLYVCIIIPYILKYIYLCNIYKCNWILLEPITLEKIGINHKLDLYEIQKYSRQMCDDCYLRICTLFIYNSI